MSGTDRSGKRGRLPFMSKTAKGVLALAVIAALASTAYLKEQISATVGGLVHGHQTIAAEFPREYKLVEYRPGGDVKIAGVKIGTVTDIEDRPSGTSLVTMQVEPGTREKLGEKPSAQIFPTLVLGGRYFVSLVPGGSGESFDADTIPVERSHVPVELYRVLDTFTPAARTGMQAGVRQLDATLRNGGSDALRDLSQHAPATLAPAGQVLDAFRGTDPNQDLTDLVVGLQHTGAAFTRRDGEVRAVLDAVQGSTRALAQGSPDFAESIRTMPDTLRVTRTGMADLQPTLDKLTVTGESFRPAARELDPFFESLDPALKRLRPVMHDLREVLDDGRPLIERFVPVTKKTTDLYDDLNGPVLDRLNGPIASTILSPWRGEGPFKGGGASGNKFYEELGYLSSRASQVFGYYDNTGAFARLSVGVGLNSVGGTGVNMSLEQYLEQLGQAQPNGPNAIAGKPGALPTPPSLLSADKAPKPPSLIEPKNQRNPLLPFAPGGN